MIVTRTSYASTASSAINPIIYGVMNTSFDMRIPRSSVVDTIE
jgi:hypothetical protein